MSAIKLLGSTRGNSAGRTRRETLKVGALSLLGGLFQTPSLRALKVHCCVMEGPCVRRAWCSSTFKGARRRRTCSTSSPARPRASGVNSSRSRRAPGIQVCELLPLSARWMHKTAVVRSVYHNGGCHKNLPMYTGFDANLPDEDFRDTDPPSMGAVCAYLERATGRERCRRMCIFPVRSVGARRQESRSARRVPGPQVRPFLHRVHGVRRPAAG